MKCLCFKFFQIKGQEADIIGETCNDHGIKLLKFSESRGPFFNYEEPTNETFGNHPNLRYISIGK